MSDRQNTNNGNCKMMGLLGILIQISLGVLSFSVLIIKRFRQRPRRPWKIWFFDTSKQVISQFLAHFINLTISIALAYNDSTSDQCLWYFTTNILDNTIGVFICILCLKGIELSLKKRRKYQYISGNYYQIQKITVQIEIMDMVRGEIKDSIVVKQDTDMSTDQENRSHGNNKHQLIQEKNNSRVRSVEHGGHLSQNETQTLDKYRINYRAWLVQLLIWISIVVIGKSLLFGFQFGLQTPLKDFTFLTMGWIQSFQVLELIVVIVIVPVIMNGLAFWVQDNFLMKKQSKLSMSQSPLIEERTPKKEDLIDIM